jgi:hypothetical protein
MPDRPLVRLIDIDGVVFDFDGSLARTASALTGRPLSHFPPAQVWDFMVAQWGLSMDEYFDILDFAIRHDGLFESGVPTREARRGWQRLLDSGDRIHVVTNVGHGATTDLAREQRIHWLSLWGFSYDEITFTGDKAPVAENYIDSGYRVATIDDHVDNILAYEGVGAESYALVRPWNHSLSHSLRVSDLEEFVVRSMHRANREYPI